jgi:hypothetical protein
MNKNDFGVFELNLPDNVRVQRSLRISLPRRPPVLFSQRDGSTAVALIALSGKRSTSAASTDQLES